MGKQHLKSGQLNGHREISPKNPLVAIASPSTKLLDDLKDTKNVLNLFGVTSEITVVAAHRSPKKRLDMHNN
jgi:phosphoribosylcarboxyaminoimidazole (NCAIR) mutase